MSIHNNLTPQLKDSNLKVKQTFPRTKFIHASDIHLGSHQYEKSLRSDDFIFALKEILCLAVDHLVDFVLLGGDVFHSLELLPGKMSTIIEILKDFKKATNGTMPIIAIEGNHDIRRYSRGVKFNHRNQSWLKVCAKLQLIVLLDADLKASPENVFEPYNFEQGKGGKLQVKNVMIYGSRYLGEKPLSALSDIRRAIKKKRGVFNILLQHFGVEGQMEKIPGVRLDILSPLHHRVDYLALGHFHKQFIVNDWIYNPGSAEAVCPMDFMLKRGIFLVEIAGLETFKKKVHLINLTNRRAIWKSIKSPYYFKKKEDFYSYVIKTLSNDVELTRKIIHGSNISLPFLILTISGIKPFSHQELIPNEIQKLLVENLPVIGVKVYQRFNVKSITLKNYL